VLTGEGFITREKESKGGKDGKKIEDVKEPKCSLKAEITPTSHQPPELLRRDVRGKKGTNLPSGSGKCRLSSPGIRAISFRKGGRTN